MSNSAEKRRIRWKRAQKLEYAGYFEEGCQQGFSKDFVYLPSPFWIHRFKRFGSIEFDGKAVLEVGCNVFGPIHYVCGKKSFKVGVDPLIGNLYKEIASKEIHYIRGVGENLPFATGRFDVVICHNVLDHVVDPKKVVSEIFRVTKRGGVLLLCVNAFSSIIRVLKPIVEHFDRIHPYHFFPKEIKRMTESCGFTVLKFQSIEGYDTCEPRDKWFVRELKAAQWKMLFGSFFLRTVYVTARK